MLPEEKNSTPREQDAFDAFLKRKMKDAPSAMPEGMLQGILEKNRKRRGAMFFWLNTVVLLYIACWFLAGIPMFDKNLGTTEPASPQTTATPAAEAVPQATAPQTTAVDTVVDPAARNNSATNTGEIAKVRNNNQNRPHMAQQSNRSTAQARNGGRKANARPQADAHDATGPVETKGPAAGFDTETAGATNSTATADVEIREPGFDEPALADIEDADAEEQDPATPTDSKGKTTKNKKPAKGGADDDKPKHWQFDAWMGLGMVRDQVDFQVSEFDPRYYHKDFASVLAQSAPKISGTQLSAGLRGFITERITLDGGLQFAQMQSIVNIEYFVKEVPVLDTSNEVILGYMQLPDTSKIGFGHSSTSNFTRIGIPLQLGYTYPIGSTWQLTGSVGLIPQVTLHQTMTAFERVDLTKLGSLQLENYFRMPTTFSLGLYRNEDRFTYGIMGRVSPFYGRAIEVSEQKNYGSLRMRGYDVGFRIMYRFGGAPTK